MKILSDEEIQSIQRKFPRYPGDTTDIDEGRAIVKDTLRQVRDLLDGIKTPRMSPASEGVFEYAIQAMKTLLEVEDGQGRTKTDKPDRNFRDR